MDLCEVFAQELRMYKVIARMGVGVAFTHVPPIYIYINRCIFSTPLFYFSQTGETLHKWTSAARALFLLFSQTANSCRHSLS